MVDAPSVDSSPRDRHDRPLLDLRVSVTDRCNFRCRYCMPREQFASGLKFLPKNALLSFEEISRLCRIVAGLGVRKVRLTGGEPLLRSELPKLVGMLRHIPDLEVALTTNGSLLAKYATPLADAGLKRVTVSLDSLDPATFRAFNDTDVQVSEVLAGIEAAERAGLEPIKINAVIRRGVNEADVVRLVEHFRGTGHVVRFIEYMDVGTLNDWRPDAVVTAREMLQLLSARFAMEPVARSYRGEVANRFRLVDGSAEIGFITSVSAPFCGDCTRLRLSAEGSLYTCLFAATGTDLKTALRRGDSDEQLRQQIVDVWRARDDRYSEARGLVTLRTPRQRVEMSYIGG